MLKDENWPRINVELTSKKKPPSFVFFGRNSLKEVTDDRSHYKNDFYPYPGFFG